MSAPYWLHKAIWEIKPQETPFIRGYSRPERTVIRFSGYDIRVYEWARKRIRTRNKEHERHERHEWVTEKLI